MNRIFVYAIAAGLGFAAFEVVGGGPVGAFVGAIVRYSIRHAAG